jgi:hypothetical protein
MRKLQEQDTTYTLFRPVVSKKTRQATFVQFHQQELEAIYRYSCSPRTVADEERLDLDLFHAGIEVDS